MRLTIKQQLNDKIGRVIDQHPIKLDKSSLKRQINGLLEEAFTPQETTENKLVTVLLSDLRGFTSTAEKHSAFQMIELLNRYFQKMSEIIFAYQGTIDKFMGDAIMVLFGAPESNEDDLERALACAIEMQQAMDAINAESKQYGLPPLYMGIGINTGQVVAGNLGSSLHSEYTVIGDEVNLASRVEAHSLRGQILISENSYQLAKDFIEIGGVNSVRVKGKQESVNMYELLATSKPQNLKAPLSEVRKSPRVAVNAKLAFKKIINKAIAPEEYVGRIIDISYGGLFAVSPVELEPHSDIKIAMSLSLMGQDTAEIYAKVLRVNPFKDHWECHIEFTHIDEHAQSAIKEFVDHEVERV